MAQMHSWAAGLVLWGLTQGAAVAQAGAHGMHQHGHHGRVMSNEPERRELVVFPDAMRAHTLRSMRLHLEALQKIQNALSQGRFDQAGQIAESALGMSALRDHHAHENVKYMPAAMAQMGAAMHQAASQFALAAQDASATGDFKKPLAALAKLSGTCVACHAAYRLH